MGKSAVRLLTLWLAAIPLLSTGAAAESPASSAIWTRRPFLSFAYGAMRESPVRCLDGLRCKRLVSEERREETAGGE